MSKRHSKFMCSDYAMSSADFGISFMLPRKNFILNRKSHEVRRSNDMHIDESVSPNLKIDQLMNNFNTTYINGQKSERYSSGRTKLC